MKLWLNLSLLVVYAITSIEFAYADYPDFFRTNPPTSPVIALLSVEAAGGNGEVHDPAYQTLDLFVTTSRLEQGVLPFFNQRVHWLNTNEWATNTGVGVRWLTPRLGRIVGANLFYDYRSCSHGSLNQVGVGFELLGDCIEFRANGYFPIGNKTIKTKKCVFDDFIGGFIMIKRRFKCVFSSADAEVEFHTLRSNGFNLFVAGGTYFLHHSRAGHSFGGYARAGLDYWRYLRVEGLYSYDRFSNHNLEGIVRLTIPFGIINDLCWTQILQPVVRNDLIHTKSHCCWETNF